MKNYLDKRFLWVSLFLHIICIMIIAFFNSDVHIHKQFLVFGAYSKKPMHAYFRSMDVGAASSSTYKQLAYRRSIQQAQEAVKKKKQALRAAIQKKKAAQAKKQATQLVQKESQAKKLKPMIKTEKISKKKVIAKQKIEKKPKIESKKKEEPEKHEQESVEEELEEELNFNLMGETDPTMVMYQEVIQKEIERAWSPPLGVDKGTECVVAFVIGKQGEIKRFNITQHSKMLIYDLSIIRVAKKFQFDRCLWGKTFTINFRQ